jgi:septum formation topological specificity factor MinE
LLGFFIGVNQMNKVQQAVVQNLCTKLQAHLDSGDALKVAIAKVKPEYNKASPEIQIEMRNEIAKVIGKYKGIKPKVMEKGDYKGYLGFDAHGSEEENQARSMLGYYFPAKKKKAKPSSTQQVAKQVDEVEVLLATLYKLSAKDQARFDVLYTKDKKAKRK